MRNHPAPARLRLLPTLVLLACSTVCAAGNEGGTPPPVAATLAMPADYQLVWADEFDTPGLPDPARWDYDTERNKAGWYNNELQYYGRARLENSEVRDGKLIITARKEKHRSARDWGGQAYTSARLYTRGKAQWTYGFFSVRAKLPCGPGTWPAIWLLGSEGDWPARGELDMMEQFGHDPGRILSTTHTTAASGDKGIGGSTRLSDVCTAFHDYQMLWTPEEIRFGIDGKEHFVYRNEGKGKAQWPYDAPEFLLLNVAIGGSLGGAVDDSILPVRMEVDYVRVWQAPTATATGLAPAATADDSADLEKALLAAHADYAADVAAAPDQTPTRYAAYRVDLDGDGRDEVLVYLLGREFCGSGGCNLEVFAPGVDGYRRVAQFTITQTPVFVGPGRSNGWLDIIRHEVGGGVPSRYVREAFDGKTYTSEGEIDSAAAAAGTIAFAENLDFEQAKPLLPAK